MHKIFIRSTLPQEEMIKKLSELQDYMVKQKLTTLKDEPIKNIDEEPEGTWNIQIDIQKVDDGLIPFLKEIGVPQKGTKFFDGKGTDEEVKTELVKEEPKEDTVTKEEIAGLKDTVAKLAETVVESKEAIEEATKEEPLIGLYFQKSDGTLGQELIKESELKNKVMELTSGGMKLTSLTTDIEKFNKEIFKTQEMVKETKNFSSLLFSDEEIQDTETELLSEVDETEGTHEVDEDLNEAEESKESKVKTFSDLYFSEEDMEEKVSELEILKSKIAELEAELEEVKKGKEVKNFSNLYFSKEEILEDEGEVENFAKDDKWVIYNTSSKSIDYEGTEDQVNEHYQKDPDSKYSEDATTNKAPGAGPKFVKMPKSKVDNFAEETEVEVEPIEPVEEVEEVLDTESVVENMDDSPEEADSKSEDVKDAIEDSDFKSAIEILNEEQEDITESSMVEFCRADNKKKYKGEY